MTTIAAKMNGTAKKAVVWTTGTAGALGLLYWLFAELGADRTIAAAEKFGGYFIITIIVLLMFYKAMGLVAGFMERFLYQHAEQTVELRKASDGISDFVAKDDNFREVMRTTVGHTMRTVDATHSAVTEMSRKLDGHLEQSLLHGGRTDHRLTELESKVPGAADGS